VGFVTICISTGGERGIRTPGPVTVNSFQDCRIRPLCHFSSERRIHYCIASANIG
jgi:site-specific DNA recombinase